jgi:hypothetical protein
MVRKGLLLALTSLSFVGSSIALEEGPADESAYWILKIHGRLLPVPILSTRKIVFAQTEVGKEATAKVKITNKGYGDLIIKKIYLHEGSQFHIKATTCTKPLDKNQSCEIVVAFKPTLEGQFKDILFLDTNDPNNPTYSVELEGNAIYTLESERKIQEEQPKEFQNKTQAPPPQVIEPVPPQEEKKKEPKKPRKVSPKYTTWEVKPCDTLWDIAASVYGDPLLWAAIYEANKDKIGDPWIIEVGTVLKIPKLTPAEKEKYRKMSLEIMQEMADRPLGPKCPADYEGKTK